MRGLNTHRKGVGIASIDVDWIEHCKKVSLSMFKGNVFEFPLNIISAPALLASQLYVVATLAQRYV